ncbi:MAG: hypothetical protein RRB13_05455 [bacterium]|nr:hypothetical protein [bacterium]
MWRGLLTSLVLWSALSSDALAVNWSKAMQMYYEDFNPMNEILATLGLIVVVVGGGFLFSRWRAKRREERIARLKQDKKDFHDAL